MTVSKKSSKSYVDEHDEVRELDEAWFRSATWVKAKAPRKSISFRVDPELLTWFKSAGPGYQSRMHAVLEAYAKAQRTIKR